MELANKIPSGSPQCGKEVKRDVLHRVTRVISYDYKGCMGKRVSLIWREGSKK
jgi:stage III sporulation protein SpoIIIAA